MSAPTFHNPLFQPSAGHFARHGEYTQPALHMPYHQQLAFPSGSVSPSVPDHHHDQRPSVEHTRYASPHSQYATYALSPAHAAQHSTPPHLAHTGSMRAQNLQEFAQQRPQPLNLQPPQVFDEQLYPFADPHRDHMSEFDHDHSPFALHDFLDFPTAASDAGLLTALAHDRTPPSAACAYAVPPPAMDPNAWPSDAATERYLRATLAIPAPVPLNLWALPDDLSGKRAPMISQLIKLAIWGSRERMLTLRQIYDAVEQRYPVLAQAKDKPWQRSIRHNLSLKAMFVNTPRGEDQPGKGRAWRLDIRRGEGSGRSCASGKGRSVSRGSDTPHVKQEELDDDACFSPCDDADCTGGYLTGPFSPSPHPSQDRDVYASPAPVSPQSQNALAMGPYGGGAPGHASYHSLQMQSPQHAQRSLTVPLFAAAHPDLETARRSTSHGPAHTLSHGCYPQHPAMGARTGTARVRPDLPYGCAGR